MKEEMTRGGEEKGEEMITENFRQDLSTNDISRVVNGIKLQFLNDVFRSFFSIIF